MKQGCLFLIIGILLFCSGCTLNLGETTIDVPWPVITVLVVIPSLLPAAFFIWCGTHHNAHATYVCPHCHHRFKPRWRVLYSPHINDDYVLRCPHCKTRDLCSMSYDQEN